VNHNPVASGKLNRLGTIRLRSSMRFVPVKSTDQQAALLHHRARDLLVRQRTMLINALRGHLGEFGIIAPVGRHRIADLISLLQDARDADVPPLAREALRSLIAELHALETRIEAIEAVIMREHKANAVSRRLASIPGIGPITASAIAATIADPSAFKSGRELAAWIGLVPRQYSSGGKPKLGRVSKQGDRYLRRLLTVGATAPEVRHRVLAPSVELSALSHSSAGDFERSHAPGATRLAID
jgi:transposase